MIRAIKEASRKQKLQQEHVVAREQNSENQPVVLITI